MDNFISSLKPISSLLETLSFIATIVLVGVSFKGLSQLRIAKNTLETAKDTLQTESIRDSRKISSDYVYIYLDRILKQEYQIKIEKEQLALLKSYRYSDNDDDSLDVQKITQLTPSHKLATREQRDTYIEKLDEAFKPFTDLLNELEAFCAAATSGVLDENTLYRAVGRHFVNLVDKNHLDQVLHYLNTQRNLYTNTTRLYDLWSLRVTVKDLEQVETRYDKTGAKIAKMKKRLGEAKSDTVQTIGAGNS
jgi:hypothetical protein